MGRETRLDLALVRAHTGLSRRRAREAIEKGQVLVEGECVREAGRLVREDAAIVWDPNRKALPRARSSLPILYGDEALVIVDKPAGLLSVPSSPDARDEDTVLARVQDYARHLGRGRSYVGRIHRLDRDTSGALAFALAPGARSVLLGLFRAHRIERRYLALVEGRLRADSGVVEAPLHTSYEGGKRRVARSNEPFVPAVTRWRAVERFPQGALLEIDLETGRQHQIRVHLAHIGLPVLGDAVYGFGRRDYAARPMLHARVLALPHPTTGALVRVESPLPPDFLKALTVLRRRGRLPAPSSRRKRR